MSKNLEKSNLFQVLQKIVDSKRSNKKSAQETLNYKRMHPNGVCHVGNKTYNKMIRFSDISYQLSQDEMKQKIFAQYSTLLNSFDNTIKIQFCFINYRMRSQKNEKDVMEYSKQNSSIEDFELLRDEYFSFLEEQAQKGNNGIVRNNYLVFSIEDK